MMDLRIASYNLRFGGRGREGPLIEVIKSMQAHIVILQEATRPAIVQKMATELKMPTWAAVRGRSLGLLSRLTLVEYDWHRVRGLKHPFLYVTLKDAPLRIFGIHLHPYFSKWTERSRVKEVKFLLRMTKAYEGKNTPHLLIGDFNTVAPGDEARVEEMPTWIRGLVFLSGGRIRPDAIKTLLQAGYIDAFRRLHPEQKGFTFPTFSPRVRLDYAFLSPKMAGSLKACSVVTSSQMVTHASDHLPLLTVFDL